MSKKTSTTSKEKPQSDEKITAPVLDYKREALQLCGILQSEQASDEIKTFLRLYLSSLALTTGVITMDDVFHDTPHIDPKLLPLLYPVMRFRDGASCGIPALIQNAVCTFASEQEQDAFFNVTDEESERLPTPQAVCESEESRQGEGGALMTGQVIKRGDRTWLVRIFTGRASEMKKGGGLEYHGATEKEIDDDPK